MRQRCFKIHDLDVRLDLTDTRMPWIFNKFSYFEVLPEEIDNPDLTISIGPVTVDTDGWMNVDHCFFARPGEIVFSGAWKGFRWKSHWRGLEEGPLVARLQLDNRGAITFPWLLQAEWLMYWFVFKPLSELVWARRNRSILHASAASRDGQAVVFTGYGSGLKTSYAMNLVRNGWDLLGDDQLLLCDDGIRCLPFSIHTFDFRLNEIETEYLTPFRLARLAVHLLRAPTPRVRVSNSARLRAFNVCVRTSDSRCASRPISAHEAVGHTFHNCYNETIANLHGSQGTYSPLTAYKIMFPGFDDQAPWRVLRSLLTQQLQDVPCSRIEMAPVWEDAFMRHVEYGGLSH